MAIVELTRLYLGYMGNLQEKVLIIYEHTLCLKIPDSQKVLEAFLQLTQLHHDHALF